MRERIAQVRGVLAEQVIIGTEVDPYLTLKALSQYSGISVRKLRDYLGLPSDAALPCYRLDGKKILVRRSDFDRWMARYRHQGQHDVARVVAEVLRDLGRQRG